MKIDDRMKEYEYVTRTYLPRRMPVIIRIDGKAFHSFTKGFQRPYDVVLANAMDTTMKELVQNIQGCVFGYVQSDEISLLLKNNQTIDTSAWFDNNISKIISISASMATLYFNNAFSYEVREYNEAWNVNDDVLHTYFKAEDKGALFDSRVFVVPEEEVVNYFIWRQEDATRNSIQMLGQCNFPHKQLQGLNTNDIQNKLFTEKGINWNDMPTGFKRGRAAYRKAVEVETPNGIVQRNKVIVDKEIPIFKECRYFIAYNYIKNQEV